MENKKTLRVKRAREYFGFEGPPQGIATERSEGAIPEFVYLSLNLYPYNPMNSSMPIPRPPLPNPQRSWGIFIFHMAEPCLHE